MKKLVLAGVFVLSAVAPAAADWNGYADTGYRYRDKRSCCEDAILSAQDDSIANCEGTGGFPVVSRSARGQCDWDSKGGTYRCTATATVRCR